MCPMNSPYHNDLSKLLPESNWRTIWSQLFYNNHHILIDMYTLNQFSIDIFSNNVFISYYINMYCQFNHLDPSSIIYHILYLGYSHIYLRYHSHWICCLLTVNLNYIRKLSRENRAIPPPPIQLGIQVYIYISYL